MGFLDKIKRYFTKKHVRIIADDFTKTYGAPEPLEIGVYESDGTPITGKPVNIEINSRDYVRNTDENGVARLNINLGFGEYDTHIVFDDPDYQYTRSFLKVCVQPKLETSDLSMTEKDGSKFTAMVTDVYGNPVENIPLVFSINGRNYERTTNDDGVAGLTINLMHGDYKILTSSYGVTLENMIHIEEAPIIDESHYGYWVFGKDMLNVNLQDLKNRGCTDLFLNYYAFTAHGETTVREWIKQARNNKINIHIWMQSFYNGEWINPATSDLTDKINEAQRYASIPEVYGVHLDYLRYPGTAYKTPGAVEAVNNFVKRVKEVTGDKFLSCAVMPENEDEYYYGQDINTLGELCDAVIPMQYKGNYNAGTEWLTATTKYFSGKATIWSGLQSYKSDDNPTILPENEIQNDIQTCRSNGAKGAILFRYGLSENIHFPQQTPTGKKETWMDGIDINMTYKDGSKYQCAVYDKDGRVAGNVNLTVNGKTYNRTPDDMGLYKLSINLEPGTYPIKAEYLGDDTHLASSVNNTIIVNETPKPSELYSYITDQGAGQLGQICGWSCGPHSLMQCIYRLTGIELSESTLMSVCGTTTSGTGHDGLATGLAWFNREYGYNLKMRWVNFSDVGFDGLQEAYENGAVFCHLLYRDQWGHYEVPLTSSSEPMRILNSLGDSCGGGYCGYIESRSQSTQRRYIGGISQKSICIISR